MTAAVPSPASVPPTHPAGIRLSAMGVRKAFGGVCALDDVSLEARAGEVHALMGENGAGKSTLIRILTGAERADAGTLAVDGRRVALGDLTPARARGLGVAVIYQQPALFPDLTVSENIALVLDTDAPWRRIDWRRRTERARDLLERVGAAFPPDRLAGALSMPEQQMVEIARAIGARAGIVLMDEPTAALSEREVTRLFETIETLRRNDAAVIYISHRMDEVFRVADRITVLRDGRSIVTGPARDFTHDSLVRHMAGRDVTTASRDRRAVRDEIALSVQALTSTAGVHDVSFHVRQGEILGIAGLVGAGRTELAETIFGLHRIVQGTIAVGGVPVAIDGPRAAMASGIAYVPEDRRRHGVIADMAVASNVSLAVLPAVSRGGLVDRARERALAERFAGDLRIKTPSVAVEVGTLSGGNQQKVAVARWLATNPSVLILDEPTQGVDVGAKAELHAIVGELAARGLAVVMISSELPEVLALADRILVMRGGRVTGTLDRAAATPERVLALALGHDGEQEP